MKGQIETDAEKIALIIIETDTDWRGNLFEAIAEKLVDETQYFTASMLLMAAHQYGINKNALQDEPARR